MNNMSVRKFFIMVSIAVCAAGTLAAAVISQPAAVVNLTKNTVITTEQLNAKVKEYQEAAATAGTAAPDALRVLEIMINDELVMQGSARDGIVITDAQVSQLVVDQKQTLEQQYGVTLTDAQFQQAVTAQFGSMEAFRKALKEQLLVDTYVRKAKSDVIAQVKQPTDTEISSFFRQRRSEFFSPESIRLSHVFIPFAEGTDAQKTNDANKATLISLVSSIRSGSLTFEKAVQDYSQDAASRQLGGSIGWLTADNSDVVASLGQGFYDAAFALEVGQISNVVESASGYHILKSVSHLDAKMLGLDDTINPETTVTVREYIRQYLLAQNQQTAYVNAVNALIQDLRSLANIRILYAN
ncbi:peptidylprolyl isomerase [Parasphaerochaeta coccoides]|uniref:PpiC-type peptidyl-prolyl cis-trans isomerase n=1 Tax=Parasphaerochaeta coccoides (strain ATCC BAA-1237 / DSM 17374 / SPN1) TaxID=760011 RepID=F4GJ65_PARC1|nr:peptidylprolyl isomerase [Parasphaerochaeta coccoides]AEC01705.1 PpiC-type peptidyl-prolyl cis-trans isomerase [Parasphaerochaeta coccoides DSM 17374]